MRAVVQRVRYANVKVEGQTIGLIGDRDKKEACGLLVLLGIASTDTQTDSKYLSDKIINLRIFEDGDGKMNLSALDIKGALLIVSQFTLYGDCTKGRRPNFTTAAKPPFAEKMYHEFIEVCKKSGLQIETGKFGADMQVELLNDGPVTLIIESKNSD